jgi:ribose transport system permease protein
MKEFLTWLKPDHPVARFPKVGKIPWRFDQRGLLVGILLLLAVLSILSPHFRQIDNLKLILAEASFIGIVAAGQTLVVLAGGIDLSVGSILALASIIAALLMTGVGPIAPINPYLAIIVALGLSALIGAGQGWLIAKRKMPPFIVTLVSLGILRSIALVVTESRTIHSFPQDFKWIADASVGGFPMPGLIMLVVFLILGYVLRNTKLGRYIYVIGGNESSARLSGVPVDQYKIYTYMLSGILAALSGIILMARLDGAVYTLGEDYGLNSVAAVIIGGTSLSGGVGGVRGTLIGVLIMTVVQNGLVMLNIAYQWHGIVIGSIILLAVFIDMERRRARQSASRVRAYQSVADETYLEGIILQIIQLIRNRFGSPFVRIYMVDPNQDDLTECSTKNKNPAPANGIADQVRRSGQATVIEEISDRHETMIDRLDPSIQSAIFIPLIYREKLIGVLEVQSPIAHAFVPEAISHLTDSISDFITPLRNAWLLECDWLAKQTRNALRNLWDTVYLDRCALAEWAFPASFDMVSSVNTSDRSGHLRQLLLETIERLNPQEGIHRPHAIDRRYDILRLTYVEGFSSDEVIRNLSISRRQYFYDLKDAVNALAHLLIHSS